MGQLIDMRTDKVLAQGSIQALEMYMVVECHIPMEYLMIIKD